MPTEEIITSPVNEFLLIDPETRLINVPKSEEIFGVYHDCNFARKYFKCPRIVQDGKDLSTCRVFICYISASGRSGRYLCEDVEVSEDGEFITFSWVLSDNVFDANKEASIFFVVQMKSRDGSEVFSTRKAQGRCYEGIDAEDEIEETYADVIIQMLERLDEVENSSNQNAILRIMDRLDSLEKNAVDDREELSRTSVRVSQLNDKVTNNNSEVENLSSSILDAKNDITALKARKTSKILWSGKLQDGTISFFVPENCFHNRAQNLTILIESVLSGSRTTKYLRYGDRTSVIALTFNKDFSGADNPAYPEMTYGAAYAWIYGDSDFFLGDGIAVDIGVRKLNTKDYAECSISARDMPEECITCVYALVPEER